MNTTNHQSKFKTKLQTKSANKSSLPNIQPIHTNLNKFGQNIPIKPNLKNIKDRDKNNLSSLTNNYKQKQTGSLSNINQNDQSEQLSYLAKKLIKKISIQTQKQLMTADTIGGQIDNDMKTDEAKETSTQGLDMWNLNKNLKQFSQTRKIAFYKLKNNNQNISTIQTTIDVLNKNKTQQIRSMYKIYGGDPAKMNNPQRQKSQGHLKFKKIYDPIRKNKFTQKDVKAYSTISNNKMLSPLGNTLYGTLPVRKQHLNLNTTIYKADNKTLSQTKKQGSDGSSSHLNPYLRTFINGSHLKRQPSNRNIEILEMNSFGPKQNMRKDYFGDNLQKKQRNIRRNRFEKIQIDKSSSIDGQNLFNDQYSKSLDCEMNIGQKIYNDQLDEQKVLGMTFNENATRLSPSKLDGAINKCGQQKKNQYEYNRSIGMINKSLLRDADNYMDKFYTYSSMPVSKISFYIDSLNHPQFTSNTAEYKSSYRGENYGQNDFGWKDKKLVVQKQRVNKQISIVKNPKKSNNSKQKIK